MSAEGFSRHSTYDRDVQPVWVTAVNTETGICSGLTRYGTTIDVDSHYYTGAVNITPAQGDQWYVERTGGVWRFLSRIPYQDPTQKIPMVEGQTVMGSSGPTELCGSEVNVHAPLGLATTPTASRPTSASVGATMFDTGLGKPIWFNGTDWVDATGEDV